MTRQCCPLLLGLLGFALISTVDATTRLIGGEDSHRVSSLVGIFVVTFILAAGSFLYYFSDNMARIDACLHPEDHDLHEHDTVASTMPGAQGTAAQSTSASENV